MSVVVPGPLRAIHKLLFHSSTLNNLEKPPVFFLLPLSELVTQVQLQTKSPPYQGHLPSPLGMNIPVVPRVWLLSAGAKLPAWGSVQLPGSKLPFFLLEVMPGPMLPARNQKEKKCLRGEKLC